MNINWFPGHMKKTRELIQNNLKIVDVVVELIDARIPISSRNPEIDSIVGDKKRIVVLNKADLSSDAGNRIWMNYFKNQGIPVILMDQNKNKSSAKLIALTNELMSEKFERLKEKGVCHLEAKIMIVGIPNVGKSTLINALAGRKSAQTGDRPGVTKSKQWVKLKGNLEMLDTPGILWPKFEDQNVAMNLAFTGAIKDEIMDIETLSLRLLERILMIDKTMLEERYKIEADETNGLETMERIAIKRGCILRSKEIDYSRVANIVIDEFRSATIGKITLEYPQN